MQTTHRDQHRSHRAGWLRAAVLGANDGIVSTAALIVGVEASGANAGAVAVAGLAGLVSGAMSMAAGEYVSVKSQADVEDADLQQEKQELATTPEGELAELAGIYERRGLDAALARRVAEQLTAKGALDAHARDELGFSPALRARPLQAAASSAMAFSCGALLPLAAALLAPPSSIEGVVMVATTLGLTLSGAMAARIGGASIFRGGLRVAFWGLLAMAASSAVGRLFDTPPV